MMTLERAADMLTAYAELIRRDGASRVEEHHYLPEVEFIAGELRERAAAEAAKSTAPSEETVPWPVVTAYSGGPSAGGLGEKVWVRLGDGPEAIEYVRAAAAMAPLDAKS